MPGLFALRLVGEREPGGLGLTDLLVIVLVADAASAGLSGDAESIGDSFSLVAHDPVLERGGGRALLPVAALRCTGESSL